MIAGEGLAGVAIAFLVAAKTRWADSGFASALNAWHFNERGFAHVGGAPGIIIGLACLALVIALLYRAGRSAAARAPSAATPSAPPRH